MEYYVQEKDVIFNKKRLNLLQEVHDTLLDKEAKLRAEYALHRLYEIQKQIESHGFIKITKEELTLLSNDDPLFQYVFSIQKGANILTEEELLKRMNE